ncbi:alpha/beta hydrolase family protein [Brevundimonas sp.]|uniref:alpha/beta hydrolase family protein n=1 Tax=Brevundimonas sp. TaxID=1871086 RepID=UPI0035B2DF42
MVIGGSDCLLNERRAWFARVVSDAPTRWVVSVDKEGAGDDPNVCADTYERTSLEAQRALDHVRAVRWLRRNLTLVEAPAVDVMATSAGGNAACALAGATEEVASVMLLSTGGGRPFDADMRALTENAGAIASHLDRVEQSPRIGETWLGNSNPEIWWWSALPLTCAPQMAGWRGPVLILQGSDDTSIPAESSRLLARQLEDHPGVTVDYRELPGAGHDLFIGAARKPDEGDGLTQALDWLSQTVATD